MKPSIVGFCQRCEYKADILLFNNIEASYQCPKCGSHKVKVIFYPEREANFAEFDDDDSY